MRCSSTRIRADSVRLNRRPEQAARCATIGPVVETVGHEMNGGAGDMRMKRLTLRIKAGNDGSNEG